MINPLTVMIAALCITGASSFVSNGNPVRAMVTASLDSSLLRMTSSVSPEPPSTTDINNTSPEGEDEEIIVVVERKDSLPKMSVAIPFLERPPVLTGELAGDFGFDPLRLAKNRESLWAMREAEIKHARLAMLAAAGWPLSELWDRKVAQFFGVPPALDAGDRVPTLWNGGLEKISPVWWGFCLGLTAAIDLYGVQRARAAGLDSDYVPGDLDFDPLGFYPVDEEGRKRMQLAEIKHGRLAMMAVLGFSVQEAVTKIGVVDETPFFFFPITRTLSQFLQKFAE